MNNKKIGKINKNKRLNYTKLNTWNRKNLNLNDAWKIILTKWYWYQRFVVGAIIKCYHELRTKAWGDGSKNWNFKFVIKWWKRIK